MTRLRTSDRTRLRVALWFSTAAIGNAVVTLILAWFASSGDRAAIITVALVGLALAAVATDRFITRESRS